MAARGDEAAALDPTVPPPPDEVAIPPEPPVVGARTLSVSSRLLAGATTFFFLAFLFAYFYLRSLNQDHMWRPAHVKPDQGLGVVFVACLVASVLLTLVAGREMQRHSRSWVTPATAGLVLGLAAIVAQCIEYTVQRFGPTNGAYASVFCAWTAFYLLAILGAMYWLETQVATELRARRSPAAHGDIRDPDRLIAPGLNAAIFFWAFLGGIGVIAYVILYPLQ
jgi:heme/copper-type cytochrome/quinol oxidase subunit 3